MYWKKSPILNHKDRWILRIINKLPILFDDDDIIPCWSLGALWNLIPDIPDCTVLFAKSEGKYGICITPLDSGLALNEIEASTPLKAVYDMVVWLLKNGYIKTKKK